MSIITRVYKGGLVAVLVVGVHNHGVGVNNSKNTQEKEGLKIT
jgi:hypothetical protein